MGAQSPPRGAPGGPWRVVTASDLLALLERKTGRVTGRPRIAAIDGRSAGGKSTLAGLLADAVHDASVVHTDGAPGAASSLPSWMPSCGCSPTSRLPCHGERL